MSLLGTVRRALWPSRNSVRGRGPSDAVAERPLIAVAVMDVGMRTLLAHLINRQGYEVVTCRNALELVERLGVAAGAGPPPIGGSSAVESAGGRGSNLPTAASRRGRQPAVLIVEPAPEPLSGLALVESLRDAGNWQMPAFLLEDGRTDDVQRWRARSLGVSVLERPVRWPDLSQRLEVVAPLHS